MRCGHLLAAVSSRLSSGTGGGNGASQDTPCGYDFSQMCAMRILPVRSLPICCVVSCPGLSALEPILN